MKKGFIGPIGDDLPSIISIMLALGIFFSAITYTLDIYNQKKVDSDLLKGSVEIARAIFDKGLLTTVNPALASYVGKSYALNYLTCMDESPCSCPANSYRFSYLVAMSSSGNNELHKLVICTWK